MYKPKQYPANGYEMNYDYKNPALVKVNGVLYSYCCLCRTYIGNENDTDWNSLIRAEYCPSCRAKVRTEQNAIRQKRHRRGKKQMKKEYEQQTGLLKEENRLLRQMVVALRDDVEQLKRRKI